MNNPNYPNGQNTPGPQNYPNTQNYPAPQNYPNTQNYPAPQNYPGAPYYPAYPAYPVGETVIRQTKGHIMFFFTCWILPLIILVPAIVFFALNSKYSSIEIELAKHMNTSEANAINGNRIAGIFFLVCFGILAVCAVIDCINTGMKTIRLTPTQIIGRNGLSNLKTINLADVTDVRVSHGVFGGAFRYGVISVVTPNGKYNFKKFYDPDSFVDEVNRVRQQMAAPMQ